MSSKKILFINHTAARTGAPINLLRFLSWFKKNTDIPFHILLQSGGELLSEFEALAPVTVLYKAPSPRTGSLYKFTRRLILKSWQERFRRSHWGLIYSNTAMNGYVLEFLAKLHCPVISHIHELEYYIQNHIGVQNFQLVKKHTDHYIAISQAVRHNLIEKHHVSSEKIDMIYDFLPEPVASSEYYARRAQAIRQELNIPKNAFLVCSSGTIDWRKGPDLFIQLAHHIHKSQPHLPIYFVWIGGERDGIEFKRLCHDIETLKMQHYIRFLGEQANPLDYFSACDVFAMVSREEPFGLVCIEAAMLAKPIVCFKGAGGPEEFVENDCGFAVPYLNIEEMAVKILGLFANEEQRISFGKNSQRKAETRHEIESVAPQIANVITQYY